MSLVTLVTATGLAVAVLAGSWLTAQAVVDGDLSATFVRFVVSILIGTFYYYLFGLSRGRRPFADRLR